MSVSRRRLLKFAATTVPTAAGLGALANAIAPVRASADSLGILLDYASGVLNGVNMNQGGPELLTTTNVRSFGAIGDGITDDTAAIHLARDAAGVGGTVVFPAGTYMVKGVVWDTINGVIQLTGLLMNIASQTWQILPGATIISKNSSAETATGVGATSTQNLSAVITVDADNVTITGGGTVDGGRATLGDRASNVSAVIMGTVNSNNLTVENIHVTEAPLFGIWGQGSRTRVLRCRFYRNCGAEVMLSSYAKTVSWPAQDTYDNEINGCYVDCTAEDPATFAHTALNIRGSWNPDTYSSYRGKILNNVVILPEGCTDTTGTACGIVMGGPAPDGLVAGNTVVNGVLGISMAKAPTARVVDNTVLGGTLAAIEVADSPGCIVQGNVIDGQGTLGSLPSGSGIWLDGAGLSNDVSIVDNHIFGINNIGRPILAGGVSRFTVTGNSIEGRYGITCTEISDIIISNNEFLGDGVGPAVSLMNSNGAVVSGNAIKNYDKGVDIVVSSGTSDNLNISNNHFRLCTTPINTQLSGEGAIGNNLVNAGNIEGAS